MFTHFLVIDFEATCQEGSVIYPQEIIEFPSILVHAATGRILSFFRTYVRPVHHPQLTDFCRDLTGITQADVDRGVSLADALKMHDQWLDVHRAKDALQMAGLQWEGRLHCGLHDALNTARLLVELMCRGALLEITGSLVPLPEQLPPQPQIGMATVPGCYCGIASRVSTVATPGPMQGRSFYSCGCWMPVCPFFMWAT